MYLTYDEYIGMGGNLDETAFRSLGWDVQKKIDCYTFSRLKKDKCISMPVKRAFFKALELRSAHEDYIKRVSDMEDPIQAGASNDGVSVSYGGYAGNTTPADIAALSEKTDKDIYDVIRLYLDGERNEAGQLLLYRGVYR